MTRQQPKSDRQQEADAIVARTAKPDGELLGLDSPSGWDTGYLEWCAGDECATLDGRYSAEILIAIGNHMLANTKRKDQGR